MRSVGMIVTLFIGCAIGITVAHFTERPVTPSAGFSKAPAASVIRGHFGAVDTIGHHVLFYTINPYTLSDTVPLLIGYGTDTRISAGIGDLRTAGFKTTSSTAGDIKPGTAGYVIVSREGGSLHALLIFHTGMKETDL